MVNKIVRKTLVENLFSFVILSLTILVFIVAGLLPAQLLERIVDTSLDQGITEPLLKLSLFYLGTVFLVGILDFVKQLLLVTLGEKITRRIRLAMSQKLRTVQTSYFSENAVGLTTSCFVNDVNAVNAMFTSGLISLFVDLLKIIGIIISMFLFDLSLGIMTVVAVPLIFLFTRVIQKRMLSAQIKHRKLISKVNNHITETLSNRKMIKLYSAEEFMENRYKTYLDANFKAVESVNFYDSLYPPLIVLFRGLLIVFCVLTSGTLFGPSAVSLGVVAGAIELIGSLFVPIESLGMELQSIQQSVAGVQRINDFFKEKDEEPKLQLTPDGIFHHREDISLCFDNVSFQYEESVTVINDINLSIQAKEKATFIGRTGVGKTTLFKLIMGLLKPTQGKITLNGIDVYQIPNEIKHLIFGYVDQNFSPISGTVRDQLTLGQTYPEERLWEVLDFVHLKEKVNSLPQTLDTPFSEGIFSQGEKQLLSIARGILSDPPILLLDEMTANLDSLTEEKINDVLRKASMSRTILSISHRLTSIDTADKVIYIEQGRVKKAGTKEEVLSLEEFQKELELEKLWR